MTPMAPMTPMTPMTEPMIDPMTGSSSPVVVERRLCPPRLVAVFDGEGWVREQLLGWRLRAGSCRGLVRPAGTLGFVLAPARWVDMGLIRARAESDEPLPMAAAATPGPRHVPSI